MSLPGLTLSQWSLLAFGGMIGTWARVTLGTTVASRLAQSGLTTDLGAPLGTLGVNFLGALIIGWVAAMAACRDTWVTPDLRLLLAVGFCGAFTTFSSFGLETITLFQNGRWFQATAYVAVTNSLVLLATATGLWLGRLGQTTP
jgi:CrcB protein